MRRLISLSRDMVMAWLALCLLLLLAGRSRAQLTVQPTEVVLSNPEASYQLIVSSLAEDGRTIDLTRNATYEVLDQHVARVDSRGLVRSVGDGKTEIVIRGNGDAVRVSISISGLEHPEPVSFQQEIIPILTKAGCNSGGCHGKAAGQNGFKLSVFGSDVAADYASLVKQSRGRRLFAASPQRSLVLRKATGTIPHGGGRRIEPDSLPYLRLRRWIAEGAHRAGGVPPVESIAVEPSECVLQAGEAQQLQVTATDTDGRRKCVTAEAEFSSNADTIAGVDFGGLIQAGQVPGEAAILVRYMDHVAVARVTLPRPGVPFDRPPEQNFIDHLVWDKLQRLGIEPSGLADDATFLRRASLDTVGTLPTAEEARRFLDSTDPQKRTRLIDELLHRSEYADYWAMRWSDLLRVDRDKVSPEGAVAITRWLNRQFAENRPYDAWAREILTASGDTSAEGAASFYKVLDSPQELSRSISQLFLGVRIECAQCHHHPFEKWSQEDYYGLAGFFTGMKKKSLPTGSVAVFSRGGADVKHPLSGEPVAAHALGATPADFAGHADRRELLAAWMTDDANPFFAREMANRLWAHYFGRGLVEPVDDLRATNPATNEPLLDALAQHLRDLDYDLQAFTRTLLSSRVYQLSAATNETNADDAQNFSHAAYKALPAEVLLDAICQATGVREKFSGWPLGYRAIQVWDNRVPSYFFRIFGRPVRASVCECERSNEPSIAQALHLMNSPEIMQKIQSPDGRVRRLADSGLAAEEIIEELYLATQSRFPTPDEQALLLEAFAQSDRRAATEDVLWTLLNTKEFIYNH